MKQLLLICAFLLIIIIHKAMVRRYFLRVQAKLSHGNLDMFKKVLGQNFQYKPRTNGLIRYKWSKFWITIRADFDEDGVLNYTDMDQRKFTILPEYTLNISTESIV